MQLAPAQVVPNSIAAIAALGALCAACSSSTSGKKEDPPPTSVQIGVPGGADGLEFAPLAEGSELRLQSFGQGGTHVLLGVRCVGFGNRAYVGIDLTNLNSGVKLSSPPPAQPQLLYCHDDVGCDLVPVLAMASGIAAAGEERNGLPVRVGVDVHSNNEDSASAAVDVVLSTKDL